MAAAVIAAAWVSYAPGLHGGFQLDDYANLPAMSAPGPVNNWPAFWRYITSGHADPTGRPLTLLSFLIDAHDWPASPAPFLRTNLILHLINGTLLALLLARLGQCFVGTGTDITAQERVRLQRRVAFAAVLGAGLWMLHPLFVSATLYIVQREAMLPATFELIGLLLWLRGRRRVLGGRHKAGIAWMLLGLGGGTLLAVLSKANGALLPLFALVIEWTLLRRTVGQIKEQRDGSACLPQARDISRKQATPSLTFLEPPCGTEPHTPSPRRRPGSSDLRYAQAETLDPGLRRGDEPVFREDRRIGVTTGDAAERASRRIYAWALAVLAGLPACVLLAYLMIHYGPALVSGRSVGRPWTEGQRLLTEPRVLMDYLRLLWLPHPFTTGLFNDQFAASTSLWSPGTTLPAILAVLALLGGAICIRKRWPAIALAILFYFAGQLMESSIIPLELYFEHRNYIPAMLMFWPLALWLCGVPQRVSGTNHEKSANLVIPAKAGTQRLEVREKPRHWIPAFAGMTARAQPVRERERRTLPRITPLKIALAVICVLGLATMTHARASVWGNTRQQAQIWARLNPDSPRAQANVAQIEVAHGHPRAAIAQLQPLLAKKPAQAQLAINLLGAECQIGHISANTLRATKRALKTTANTGALLVHWFDRSIDKTRNPPCPQLTLPMLSSLADATLANTALMKHAGQRQNTWYIKGRIALAGHHADLALTDFNRALAQQVRYAAALKQAALLGASGHPQLGLAHLRYFDHLKPRLYTNTRGMARIHAWVLTRQHYWTHELKRLRANLREAAAESG